MTQRWGSHNDVYGPYRDEAQPATVISEDIGKVFNCSDCGYHHNNISFLVDPYEGKYYICQMSKKKVFYK